MSTDIFQSYTNPISGETFKCISFNAESLTMQWTVQLEGYVPFEHIHLNLDEVFHIRQGEIKIIIDGKEHIAHQVKA